MGSKATANQKKSANNTAQNPSTNRQFRGAAIHIREDGTFAVELVGITPMELYGALALVTEKVKKQLGGDGGQ